MSTKIFIGQKTVDPDPFVTLKDVRFIVDPIFQAKYRAAVEKAEANKGKAWGEVFALPVGHWARAEEPIDERIGETVYEIVVHLHEKVQYHTFSELDFGYDAVVLPNPLPGEPPLFLLFSERAGDEYRKALVEAEVVIDYGYWNNTDKPKEVSETEWLKRQREWDGPGSVDVPAQDGFNIEMPSEMKTVWQLAADRALARREAEK